MARNIGAELVDRLKHMNDRLMPITPSESDSPQPVAWAVLGDGFEYVSMTPEMCVAWAGENGGKTVPLYATPDLPSTPAEATSQDQGTLAVTLMCDYASRYGYLLGGLEMVAAGHTTAEAVLARIKEKYGE